MLEWLIPYLKFLGMTFFNWHVLVPALLVGVIVFIVTYYKGRKEMEKYPEGFVSLNLMINPKTKEIHIVGGDREEGEGDQPYVGMKVLKSMFCTCDGEIKCDGCSKKDETHSEDPSDVGC